MKDKNVVAFQNKDSSLDWGQVQNLLLIEIMLQLAFVSINDRSLNEDVIVWVKNSNKSISAQLAYYILSCDNPQKPSSQLEINLGILSARACEMLHMAYGTWVNSY